MIAHPRGCASMIRVSLSYIFEFSAQVEGLERLPDADTTYGEVFFPLYDAESAISTLYQHTPYAAALRSSSALAGELLTLIRAQTEAPPGNAPVDFNRQILRFVLWQIREAYKKFKIAFLAELG